MSFQVGGEPQGNSLGDAPNKSARAVNDGIQGWDGAIIGAVQSGNIAAERDTVKAHLERGISDNPEATWVTEPRSTMIRDLLLQLGVKPVVLSLQDEWKTQGGDYRRTMRDGDLLRMCDPLVVFHKAGSHSPWIERDARKTHATSRRRVHENLHLVELGKPKRGKKSA